MPETNELLARVERSIAEVEADDRPPPLKVALLAALRRERDSLAARRRVEIPAGKKKPGE